MMYEIHLYVPKTGRLTDAMIQWLYAHGQDPRQPEHFWPVRRLRPYVLARHMLRLDPTLIAVRGAVGEDVELHYPDPNMGIVLYVHDRGVIVFFPYMAYSVYSRVVLGICNVYIRHLYLAAGFWSYDPQLNTIAHAGDYRSMEETAVLMDMLMPRLLEQPNTGGLSDGR